MFFEGAVFLAAMGITTLEVVETAAVALALHAHSGRDDVFVYAGLGTAAVFAPMFVLGAVISSLPDYLVELVAAILLAYFGQRLARSARRAVVNARAGKKFHENFAKSDRATAFSVGAVEAFEAAIVLVGLLPNNFQSTVVGMAGGIGAVVVATFVLRDRVRKVKQADMKIAVSALLFSFATFWLGNVITPIEDVALVLLFLLYAALVYWFANRPSIAAAGRLDPAASSGALGAST